MSKYNLLGRRLVFLIICGCSWCSLFEPFCCSNDTQRGKQQCRKAATSPSGTSKSFSPRCFRRCAGAWKSRSATQIKWMMSLWEPTSWICERFQMMGTKVSSLVNRQLVLSLGWLSDRNDLNSLFLRLSSHTWTCLGQHVRLHPYLHPDGWIPGVERRPRGGSVLQGPSAHQSGCGDTWPLLTWNYQLHRGAGGGSTQHIRGELLLAWAAMQTKLLNPAASSLFCSYFELLILFFKPILCIINTLFTLTCLVIVLVQCKSHKLSWDVWDVSQGCLHHGGI